MKYGFRGNPWVKAIALILFVALASAAFFGVVYSGMNWDSFFAEGDWTASSPYVNARQDRYRQLRELTGYALRGEENLDYLQERSYEELRAAMDPEATNYRYIVRRNATGEILLSSTGEGSLDTAGDVWRYGDAVYVDEEEIPLAIEVGVEKGLTIRDEFYDIRAGYTQADDFWLYATAAAVAAALGLLVFLFCCAGRRPGAEEPVLNWSDKVPYDLYLCAVGGVAVFCAAGAVSVVGDVFDQPDDAVRYAHLLATLAATAAGFALLAAAAMSTATRLKSRTLLKNTVVWRLCRLLWRWVKAIGRGIVGFFGAILGHWSMTGKLVGCFLIYLAVNAFLSWGMFLSGNSGFCMLLLLMINGATLFALCRWTAEWHRLRVGTVAIVGGAPETAIDVKGMRYFPDLRQHAEQLNDLGGAINAAVSEKTRSERMKAELITNVSHDLKTPLTSIINYVDLLKKEDVQGEKAREYIEVLDRKSQRLKKLTEDLVEASKVSTGNLTVNVGRLGVVQLVTQALGEYQEKFGEKGLEAVPVLPEEECFVLADGRYLWRVLENLFSNCCKYALSGTRVYLEVRRWNGNVILAVKNISAQPLNIPAEQLLERFVRGDESRTTEGSGLGLSIAQSLTELQGGAFRLEIDGDLFKAVVSFPECPPNIME